jgi:sugar phosphate isomerase/epimerase
MISPGLVSISFRSLSAEDLILLVCKARLKDIEWGGDIHVPQGDIRKAKSVGEMTREAGLAVAAYGSYYRIGVSEIEIPFGKILDTAEALEAPVIRTWAGKVGDSLSATEAEWKKIIEESRRVGKMAQDRGMMLSFEFHSGTLNDRAASCERLLNAIGLENVNTYWQPTLGIPAEDNLAMLQQVKDRVGHLHVFHWINGAERRPLEEGKEDWAKFLSVFKENPTQRFAMLEFIQDDDPDQFLEDAEALKALLADL